MKKLKKKSTQFFEINYFLNKKTVKLSQYVKIARIVKILIILKLKDI